jgi:hypothetical protein
VSGTAKTILCLASYEKGQEFLRECKRAGSRVYLITLESLKNGDWPRESLNDTFYMPTLYDRESTIKAVSYLARSIQFDSIVALDDYDVETAALLREHLRIPGMGDTTARHFRDKLAMRVKARSSGILVPEFVHVLHHPSLAEFMERVCGPWVMKPRSEASAIGIKKIHRAEELWPMLETLGDRQSYFVLEQFVAGEVFHVDSIVSERRVVFAVPHKYGLPPMAVAHEGGIFTTRTISADTPDARALLEENRKLIAALGLVRGVTHTEFIKGRADGRFYFLETASRVGGANIAEVVEAATGINLWREWARIEIAGEDAAYNLPAHRNDYAGIVISLAKQEWPDTTAYNDPEIAWRMKKKHHVGLIVASPDPQRVESLLADYARRIAVDFFATAPLPDKPTA